MKKIDSKDYKATCYEIDSNFNDIWHIHYFFDNLYIAANKTSGDSVICKYNKQGTFLDEITLEVKKDVSILDFHISKEDDIFCLITSNPWKNLESSTNQLSFIKLIHFNKKGEKISGIKLKFPYERKSQFQDHGLLMEDSNIAILADQKTFLFDKDGNLSNQENINGISLCLDSYENLLIPSCFSSKYVFKQLFASSKKTSKEYKTLLSDYDWIKTATMM